MSEAQDDRENDHLSEGGGSGGGSDAVREQRQRISPIRGPIIVAVVVLAIIVLVVPVLWIGGYVTVASQLGVLWAILSAMGLLIAVPTLFYLIRRSV